MPGQGLGRRYAEAAWQLAERDGTAEVWQRDLALVADLAADSEIARGLDNPAVPLGRRREAVREALGGRNLAVCPEPVLDADAALPFLGPDGCQRGVRGDAAPVARHRGRDRDHARAAPRRRAGLRQGRRGASRRSPRGTDRGHGPVAHRRADYQDRRPTHRRQRSRPPGAAARAACQPCDPSDPGDGMTIRSDEIVSIIKHSIEGFEKGAETRSVGTVVEVGDGIAQIYGLSGALSSRAAGVPRRRHGHGAEPGRGDRRRGHPGRPQAIKEGDTVKTTGRVVEVPVGAGAARPRGRPARPPARRQGPDRHRSTRPVERIAPGVITRQSVDTPVQTGIKAIDALIPIGRGQRELIIGDRQTGKSALAIDTIINQKGKGLVCIYVAIGQKLSTVAKVVAMLEQHGAMEHTIVVVRRRRGVRRSPVHRPLRRLRHGRGDHGERRHHRRADGQGRPVRLRRPLQARLGLPRDVAAAAPPARPRGLPGRRLLPPQPAARTGGPNERRERRRIADRPADHRDPGGRHLGLHPHQRHLDHGRPDLPGDGPLQRRPAPGAQHRAVRSRAWARRLRPRP